MDKKGDLPGWNVIIMLILGILGLGILIYIAVKTRGEAVGLIDFIRDLVGI
jgi:hypothetical protein